MKNEERTAIGNEIIIIEGKLKEISVNYYLCKYFGDCSWKIYLEMLIKLILFFLGFMLLLYGLMSIRQL